MNKGKLIPSLAILFWFMILVGLISNVLIFIFFFMIKLNFGLLSIQPIWLIPLLFILLCGIGLVLYGLVLITKRIISKNYLIGIKRKQKYFLLLISIISFIAIGFIGNIILSLFYEKPPQFIPFDDPDATYTITKRGENYMLKYESTGDMNSHQVCDRINGKTQCRVEVDREIEAMIGNSEIPLDELVGKPLKVTGEFVYSDQQCIAGECHYIGGWAVLNIESIEEI